MEIQKVPVPVPVPCIDAAKVPTIPQPAVPQNGDTGQLAGATAAYVYALRAYARSADALMRPCVIQPKEKTP